MKRTILLLTTLSFTACGPFLPQSGEYTITGVTLNEDGCGFFASETQLDPFTIDFSYSCEGTDCAAYATEADVPIPCTSGYSVTAATPEI